MILHSEWILLILLAVVLLKPEEIPVLAKSVSKIIKYGKSLWHQIIDEFYGNSAVEDVKKHPFHTAPQGSKTQPIKD